MTDRGGRRRAVRARWSEEAQRQQAFEEVVVALDVRARDYAATLLRNDQDQVDAVSIAFEALARYWDAMAPEDLDRKWRFVKSRIWWEAGKVWRRRRRFSSLDDDQAERPTDGSEYDAVTDRLVLVPALRAISDVQRLELVLYSTGMGPAEIAEARGVSVNTVKSSMRGGKRAAANVIGRG